MRAGTLFAAGALAFLAGCASKPAPEPVPAPRPQPVRPAPVPQPEPTPAAPSDDWRDVSLSDGTWAYSRDASGSRALFGPSGSEASFTIRCDPARRLLLLARSGSALASRLTIRTTSAEQAVSATVQREPLASLAAALAASDPLLDAIAFSRGRFVVETEGQPRLVLPAWPEPARVIEDCRE